MEFFEDSNALDSLRHSDFDSLSAYGEVIDNSLQAEATKISIKMNLRPPRNNYQQIETLVFGDDGYGMPKDILHACLKLGWSSRFNDRSGIGRFGVGMVLGGIHEVKRIEVYSKQKNEKWRYTYIDLDEIDKKELDGIPEPTVRDIPDEYKSLAGEDQGTVVVWSKYDKQKKTGPTILREAEKWIGRTFRYFIWDGVKIQLNGTDIKAHDPLYARTANTEFPNDPKAKLYDPIKVKWRIPSDDDQPGSTETSIVEIRMSLLPEEFRPSQGSGGSKENIKRRIEENEGISILRNRREVFYGNLPYWSNVRMENSKARTWSWDEKDRWWGCEVHFNAELDSDFSVRNIKRGAEPQPELKKLIKKLITPTRKSALEQVDMVWSKARELAKENREKEKEKEGRGPHSEAEDVAGKVQAPNSKFNADKSAEEAANDLAENFLANQDEAQRAQTIALFNAQPFTINEEGWKGSTFWEIYHALGSSLITYNTRHEFFQMVNSLLDSLSDGSRDPKEVASDMKTLIDLLLLSSAKAQALNEEDDTVDRVGDFLDQHNNQWGMMLTSYVRAWQRDMPSE